MKEQNLVQNLNALRNLPKYWEVYNYGEVLKDCSSGNTKILQSDFLEQGKFPIVDQGKGLVAGYSNESRNLVIHKPPYIIFGDHTRIFKYIDFQFVMGADGIKVIKATDENKHFEKYLYFFMLTLNIPNTGYNRHYKYLKDIKIPLPPLSTQKKIAAILDAADLYRQKTKTLLEKYNQLAQSLFLDMFGDLKGEKCTLDLCCELNPKKSEISHLERNTIVSFVPMANVSEKGELQLEDNRELCDVWNGFTFFKENDVVFAKITPCMENGKGAIMKNLKNGIGFGTTEFHVLRPIEKVSSPTWLYYLTTNEKFRKEAEKNMTGSAGQKRVPIDFFRKYQVICPPISLQTQFADRIQLIEAQKQQAQSTLQKAETLFNSLLQRAFNGELVN